MMTNWSILDSKDKCRVCLACYMFVTKGSDENERVSFLYIEEENAPLKQELLDFSRQYA